MCRFNETSSQCSDLKKSPTWFTVVTLFMFRSEWTQFIPRNCIIHHWYQGSTDQNQLVRDRIRNPDSGPKNFAKFRTVFALRTGFQGEGSKNATKEVLEVISSNHFIWRYINTTALSSKMQSIKSYKELWLRYTSITVTKPTITYRNTLWIYFRIRVFL